MNTVSLSKAVLEVKAGTAQIIDVREPLEFDSNKLDAAINMPSSVFDVKNLDQYKNKKIVLVCQSGGRANMILQVIKESGFNNVFVADKHMGDIEFDNKKARPTTSTVSWTVDRQFRMTLGMLLVIFLIGYNYFSHYFMLIPIILATGLVFTSIINKCYMRIGISKLPWNRNQECKD